jgi:hypothetical protein|tara:strand:- start:114 stop:539 length:426 start_codon:yes stop_codon:yes gene_type:complete
VYIGRERYKVNMKIEKYNDKLYYVDNATKLSKVYLVQEIPTDRETGKPKFDITAAMKYGEIKTMFPRLKQMQFSPGPLIIEIKRSLKNFTPDDYLLLYGDPALIGVVCAVASDVTNGRFKLLKWDRIQSSYFPIEINLFQK